MFIAWMRVLKENDDENENNMQKVFQAKLLQSKHQSGGMQFRRTKHNNLKDIATLMADALTKLMLNIFTNDDAK